MKNIILISLFSILIIMTINVIGLTDDPINDRIDVEKLTPSEKHQILAESKARQLSSARALADAAAKTPSVYDQTDYDIGFYRIDLNIDIVAETIAGDVLIQGEALTNGLDSIEIDLNDDLTVDSLYYNGGLLNYNHAGNKIFVELDQTYNNGEQFSFSVVYNGAPASSGFLGFSFDLNTYGDKVVSSLSEPMAARTWWPCKDRPDDKADSIDIIITCDEPYYCASNGTLIDTASNGDGTWTFNYEVRYPITTYLFSVAISEYTVWDDWYHHDVSDSMLIRHHVYPNRYVHSLGTYNITPDILEVMADIFGEYPFLTEKYGHANFEWGGGMEHQTVTSMTGGDFGFSQDVVVHEAAHQWFGDMITCENWHHIWLNEGFASYCEALYREVKNGVGDYQSHMNGMFYDHGGTIYAYDTTDVWGIFTTRVYDKGAWVLHMLRHLVGDSLFFEGMRDYYSSPHQHSHANTEDFRDLMEVSTGIELDYFFDQWIYGTYYPRYNWSYMSESDPVNGGYYTYFYIWQTQPSPPLVFSMPIDLVFTFTSDVDTIVQFNDVKDTVYIYHTTDQPLDIELDPDNWIQKQSSETSWGFHLVPFPLDSGEQYSPYLDSVVAKGGSGNNEYAISSGALPDGLTLDIITGYISGMPTEFGDFTIEIQADDQGGSFLTFNTYQLSIQENPGLPGDANNDGTVNLLDITFIIDFVYNDGQVPDVMEQADPDQSCMINILDVTHLINYLYNAGLAPLWGCA